MLDRLQAEKEARLSGGIYHRVQIDLTYNSNHMEGSRLTHDQTRFIFDTNTISADEGPVSVDDILETTSHFRCIDWVIDNAKRTVCEKDIKNLHFMLKNGTSDSKKEWFATGEYKLLPNEVGDSITTAPEHVAEEMSSLLAEYNAKPAMTIEDLIDFHVRFERIHPFQDGNGRVGRLILFKECLHWAIVPFIIEDDLKRFYYRGLREWDNMRGNLKDTCITAQNRFKKKLDYFQIRY
ncbi:MAG: Fic family protein [Desulfovibrionaceae bacterium]|nr:Fic family protein [Desulfovibrionaceae bacterium]